MEKENQPAAGRSISKRVENGIERFLWHFRLIILVGVIGLIAGSAVMFTLGIIETYNVVDLLVNHIIDHGRDFEGISSELIVGAITIVDDFLLAIVLLIFGLAIYDLFVSRIDPEERTDASRPDWLVFTSLEDVKNTLGKVVVMIMAITFLKYVVNLSYKEPLDLIYLAASIALVSLALALSHAGHLTKIFRKHSD